MKISLLYISLTFKIINIYNTYICITYNVKGLKMDLNFSREKRRNFKEVV